MVATLYIAQGTIPCGHYTMEALPHILHCQSKAGQDQITTNTASETFTSLPDKTNLSMVT